MVMGEQPRQPAGSSTGGQYTAFAGERAPDSVKAGLTAPDPLVEWAEQEYADVLAAVRQVYPGARPEDTGGGCVCITFGDGRFLLSSVDGPLPEERSSVKGWMVGEYDDEGDLVNEWSSYYAVSSVLQQMESTMRHRAISNLADRLSVEHGVDADLARAAIGELLAEPNGAHQIRYRSWGPGGLGAAPEERFSVDDVDEVVGVHAIPAQGYGDAAQMQAVVRLTDGRWVTVETQGGSTGVYASDDPDDDWYGVELVRTTFGIHRSVDEAMRDTTSYELLRGAAGSGVAFSSGPSGAEWRAACGARPY